MLPRKIFAVAGLLLLGCSGSAFAGSKFAIQTGAFLSEDEAIELAVKLEAGGQSPVAVRPEEVAAKGLFYKVLVGDYDTRADAVSAKESLAAQGVKGYVRSAESFDKTAVQAAITGAGVKPYFAIIPGAPKSEATTLTEALALEKKAILKGDTTSPETLRAYGAFVAALPDESTVKGSEIVRLGYHTSFGRSVYNGESKEFTAAQTLLRQVANGEIAATDKDRLTAREMVAHHLHYYSRNYTDALLAYRQLLAEQLAAGNAAAAAKARMEIAATSYELAKVSGFDLGQLQVEMSGLWDAAVAMQEPFLEDRETTDAKDIRTRTARIGLMLTEILMDRKQWEEAKGVANSVVSIYADFPGCDAERAESYCHLANVGLHLDDRALCDASIAEAIRLSQKVGPSWGDQTRDPLWKSYALKIVAARYFKESSLVRAQIKNEMFQKFPDHPSLSKYFGEEMP